MGGFPRRKSADPRREPIPSQFVACLSESGAPARLGESGYEPKVILDFSADFAFAFFLACSFLSLAARPRAGILVRPLDRSPAAEAFSEHRPAFPLAGE